MAKQVAHRKGLALPVRCLWLPFGTGFCRVALGFFGLPSGLLSGLLSSVMLHWRRLRQIPLGRECFRASITLKRDVGALLNRKRGFC